MKSVIAARLRLATSKTAAACFMHTSAVQQVGRKKVPFKRLANVNRKEHATLYDEEEQENDIEDLEDWEFDDHHYYGHLLMESVRDVRKYVRQMKFEFPTLAEHAKPFRAPPAPNILQFESSSTMGEKFQAEDRKVVLRVKVAKLGLTGTELHKFILLAGVRYNPRKDELKMSESREISSLLNKKRLGDTLAALIAEAKNDADSFIDVPLDFRHVGYKPKAYFPKEWMPGAKK